MIFLCYNGFMFRITIKLFCPKCGKNYSDLIVFRKTDKGAKKELSFWEEKSEHVLLLCAKCQTRIFLKGKKENLCSSWQKIIKVYSGKCVLSSEARHGRAFLFYSWQLLTEGYIICLRQEKQRAQSKLKFYDQF